MNEKKLVPKLRFSSFEDEWQKCKLQEICKVQDGTHSTPNYVDEGIPFYSVETITSDAPPKFISKEEHEKLIKRCEPKFGDILLTRIGTLAKSKVIDWNNEFSIYVSLALLSSIKINNYYLNQYIQTETYQKEFLKRSLLLAVPQKINLKDLNETIVKFPSIKEQEKIAMFFSEIDKKIELLEKKHHCYLDFKKYLMQQIFSQKLRFARFSDDWELKKLGDITKINTGKKDVKDKKDDGKYPFFVRSEKVEKIDSYSFDGEAILIPGDGKIGEVYHYINGKFDYHQRVYKISNFNNGVHGKYIYYYLEKNFLRQAMRNTAKATVDSLRLDTLTKMPIELPSIEEQVMIAELLTLADKKINLLEKDIENIKEFKKGLLQQMFV